MLMNIGRIVRERRQAKGMTIEQLAEKADVSVSLISRLERERVDNIKLANLAAIANALQLQMADFSETRVCKPLKLLSCWTTWPSSLKRNVKMPLRSCYG